MIRAMTSRWPYVFSGSADHSIKVWDIKDKDMKNSHGCIATFTGHSGDVRFKILILSLVLKFAFLHLCNFRNKFLIRSDNTINVILCFRQNLN